jgi:hypothetical protein
MCPDRDEPAYGFFRTMIGSQTSKWQVGASWQIATDTRRDAAEPIGAPIRHCFAAHTEPAAAEKVCSFRSLV